MDGLLLVDKPSGPTSHDMVARVRRALGQRRVGHAGTLDPFATGLLLVLLGRATRLSRYLVGLDKTYEGVIRLGRRTETGDREGRPLGPERPVRLEPGRAAEVALDLEGARDQVPPAYSAKKVGGTRSYRLAREGRPPRLDPVPIVVKRFEILPGGEGETLCFRAEVSSGTYLRGLAEELGEGLGCGAHLEELRRVAVGPLQVADAVAVETGIPGDPGRALLSLGEIPLGLPTVRLRPEEVEEVRHGRALLREPGDEPFPGGACRLLDEQGGLVGVGEGETGPGGGPFRARPRTILV